MYASIVEGEDGVDEGSADLFPHGEVVVEVAGIEVIEEDSSYSPFFFSVGDIKVSFSVFGEFWVEIFSEGVESIFCRLVEVEGIFVVGEAHGGEVVATAEPMLFFCFDVADVHVDGGGVGVAHMCDEAYSGREEGAFAVVHGEVVAGDTGPVDRGFFKDVAVDCADFPSAAGMVFPGGASEVVGGFDRFEVADDFVA